MKEGADREQKKAYINQYLVSNRIHVNKINLPATATGGKICFFVFIKTLFLDLKLQVIWGQISCHMKFCFVAISNYIFL